MFEVKGNIAKLDVVVTVTEPPDPKKNMEIKKIETEGMMAFMASFNPTPVDKDCLLTFDMMHMRSVAQTEEGKWAINFDGMLLKLKDESDMPRMLDAWTDVIKGCASRRFNALKAEVPNPLFKFTAINSSDHHFIIIVPLESVRGFLPHPHRDEYTSIDCDDEVYSMHNAELPEFIDAWTRWKSWMAC